MRGSSQYFMRAQQRCPTARPDSPRGAPSVEACFNNPPSFRNLGESVSFSVLETQASGSRIAKAGYFEAIDPDDVHSVIHTLTSAAPPDTPFEVMRCGGDIRLKEGRHLDFESIPEHVLNIRADDEHQGLDALMVRVLIQDVDEPPVVSGAELAADEDAKVGHRIFTVEASDDGGNDRFHFSFEGAHHGGHRFAINDVTGALTVKQPLDFELKERFVSIGRPMRPIVSPRTPLHARQLSASYHCARPEVPAERQWAVLFGGVRADHCGRQRAAVAFLFGSSIFRGN